MEPGDAGGDTSSRAALAQSKQVAAPYPGHGPPMALQQQKGKPALSSRSLLAAAGGGAARDAVNCDQEETDHRCQSAPRSRQGSEETIRVPTQAATEQVKDLYFLMVLVARHPPDRKFPQKDSPWGPGDPCSGRLC